ncbi:hypothetical protein BASA60_010473 [Batrachochytrium salamandrivorans]|nr:hypothetical protein BASA60_010473 [Batrachochytrium salamandrivorans]
MLSGNTSNAFSFAGLNLKEELLTMQMQDQQQSQLRYTSSYPHNGQSQLQVSQLSLAQLQAKAPYLGGLQDNSELHDMQHSLGSHLFNALDQDHHLFGTTDGAATLAQTSSKTSAELFSSGRSALSNINNGANSSTDSVNSLSLPGSIGGSSIFSIPSQPASPSSHLHATLLSRPSALSATSLASTVGITAGPTLALQKDLLGLQGLRSSYTSSPVGDMHHSNFLSNTSNSFGSSNSPSLGFSALQPTKFSQHQLSQDLSASLPISESPVSRDLQNSFESRSSLFPTDNAYLQQRLEHKQKMHLQQQQTYQHFQYQGLLSHQPQPQPQSDLSSSAPMPHNLDSYSSSASSAARQLFSVSPAASLATPRPTQRKRSITTDSFHPTNTDPIGIPRQTGSQRAAFDDLSIPLSGSANSVSKVKNPTLYKTELCRAWEETGACRYGNKCQFAHSAAELRLLDRHPKYKTEMCKTFWERGSCLYGKRCCFIHLERTASEGLLSSPAAIASTAVSGKKSASLRSPSGDAAPAGPRPVSIRTRSASDGTESQLDRPSHGVCSPMMDSGIYIGSPRGGKTPDLEFRLLNSTSASAINPHRASPSEKTQSRFAPESTVLDRVLTSDSCSDSSSFDDMTDHLDALHFYPSMTASISSSPIPLATSGSLHSSPPKSSSRRGFAITSAI